MKVKVTRNELNKLHSYNGEPAVVYLDGTQVWYKNGKRHRENDLPAIDSPKGAQCWYKDGELHRENAPAIIKLNGTVKFYINNVHIELDTPRFQDEIKHFKNVCPEYFI